MKHLYIGIDIGANGGLSQIITDEEGKVIKVDGAPLLDLKNKVFPPIALFSAIISTSSAIMQQKDGSKVSIIVERTQAMPGQGVVSMYNYGKLTGEVKAALEIGAFFGGLGENISITWVTPQAWKKALGLKGGKDNKKDSISLAKELYPDSSSFIKFKKDDGIAEALLIAHYGKEFINKQQTNKEKETKND